MPLVPILCRRRRTLRLFAALLAAPVLGAAATAASPADSSFFGLVEGAATVERAGVGAPVEADQPLLAGDRLTTGWGSRVEVRLGEETTIFVAGDGAVVFAALAGAGAEDDPANLLLLERGELLVASEAETESRVDTDNATLYLGAGSYRVERGDGWTQVTVRRGEAELRTPGGAVVVAAGQQAAVEGDGAPLVEPAGEPDLLERWAAALELRREPAAEDEESVVFALDAFDVGFDAGFDAEGCDGGATCSFHHEGAAGRTRPPSDPDRHAVPVDPAMPVDPEPDDDGSPALEVAEAKPLPLEVAITAEEADDASPPASVEGVWAEPAVEGGKASADDAPAEAPTVEDTGGGSEPAGAEAPRPDREIEPYR